MHQGPGRAGLSLQPSCKSMQLPSSNPLRPAPLARWPPLCRCSLVYESLVAAIKDELQAARRRAAAAASQATAAEQRVQASMYYNRERFAEMEQMVKRTAQVSGRGPACTGCCCGSLGGMPNCILFAY